MQPREIVLPTTEPETEWIRGRPLQKVSPLFDHARVQMKFAFALDAWAQGRARGSVGTEWRFRVAPPGEALRPLVPDVAYVSAAALSPLSHEERQAPPFAPTVAVEVLSPGDRAEDVDDKTLTYLRAGAALVIIADPRSRSFALNDTAETRTVAAGEILRHPALPDFALDVDTFFAAALDV
jgi:Uma2 family endonuclease